MIHLVQSLGATNAKEMKRALESYSKPTEKAIKDGELSGADAAPLRAAALMIVTECVPDSDAQKIHIISARITKGGNGQELNIESTDSPQLTSKTVLDSITTNNSIPQKPDLSTDFEKASQENAEKAVFGTKTAEKVTPEADTYSEKYCLTEAADIGKTSIAYNERHDKVNAAVMKVGVETMIEMAHTMLPYLDEEGILPPDTKGKTIFKNGSYGRSGENTTLCVRTLTYEDFTYNDHPHCEWQWG